LQGERDVLGNLYKNPARPLTPASFQLVRLDQIGGYAVQPVLGGWAHDRDISFDYLKRVGESEGN